MENFEQVEHFKDREDSKISEFDSLYRPYEFTPFHEIFYFNNLNTNTISNNIASGSFGGNLISIFDPFKNRNKKNNSTNSKYFSLNFFKQHIRILKYLNLVKQMPLVK